MEGREICIEVRDLRKTYQRGTVKALDGVDLSVFTGEAFGLIGPNGAGKSTLMGCLLGLLRPDCGTVHIAGKPADYLSVRRVTGYVPERPDFEGWMTARQLLCYHHMLARRDPASMEDEIAEALTAVELDPDAWDRRLGTFSRGMLQRLNLAQLVIGKPSVLLLDEPTLGLDPLGVAVVRRLVRTLMGSGVTAIINSHQLDEIERDCDRVAFMRQGRIEAVEDLKGTFSGPYVLFIRWSPVEGRNGDAPDVVAVVARAGASIEHLDGSWGRFQVCGREGAKSLIKELVLAGVPVEEAVTQRGRLERLFAKDPEGRSDE